MEANSVLNEETKQEPEKPLLTTKDELVATIKEWLKMDNEISKLKLYLLINFTHYSKYLNFNRKTN